MDVLVDDQPVRALVDSGASFSVISEAYRRKRRKVMFLSSKNVILKVADGSYVKPLGTCVLKLTIDGRTQPCLFTVMSKCSHDLILGFDFLNASKAVIDCGRAELKLDELLQDQQKELQTYSVYAMSDTVIPASSFRRIAAQVKELHEGSDLLIEGNKFLGMCQGIAIPSTIASFIQGKGSLWMANGHTKPRFVPKGMCIGHASLACPNILNTLIELPSYTDLEQGKSVDSVDYSQMIAKTLNDEQKNQLQNLLRKFQDTFHGGSERQKCKIKVKHKINTGDHPAISQRPYRVSPSERRIINDEVESMLNRDIIQPSESPWSSPVVLVRKKDGSWRFCVDYRRLNKITKKDVYPLPRIDDTLDCLKGAQYFSSMDLYSGYWQIEVDENDREKTAFITSEGLYEFKVMPFGLCNAPATFERTMDNLLRHLKWKMCLCYLDDIVVFSQTFSEHLRRLQSVLTCVQEAGLVLNPKKCCFGAKEIKILGHLISEKGIKPDPDKVKAVNNFPVPKTVKDVKSFLGLCSYYRRFIRNFCFRAKPLQDLLKGDKKFSWDQAQEDSFKDLKSAMTSQPVLALFDEDSPTELHTDASGYGIGAVLVQHQNGSEKVIAYASRTLSKAEQNYSTTERECLAAIWAITKFRPYLFGKFFNIVTDHHSLCWLANLRDPSGRLARWALRLQEYSVSIIHRSGKKHGDADCLSRNPVNDNCLPEVNSLAAITDLAAKQRQDPSLDVQIRACEESGDLSQSRFSLVNDVLCKKNFDPSGKQWLPVIPKNMRLEILRHFHDEPTAGHLGFAKTYDRLRKRFFWPGLLRSVRLYVAHCKECQRRKTAPLKPPGYLVPIPPAEVPFQRIGMDLLGRFPKSQSGNKWIIVSTDYLTRYAITKALPTAEAPEIAKFLVEEILLTHGAPRTIITDRGQVFQSKLIAEINKQCNVIHRMTTAYHPQTNGLTEKFNKTLADMLSMYVDVEQKTWDQILPFVTFAYNTSKQDTTGYTPFFLTFGREAETTLDTIFHLPGQNTESDYVARLIMNTEESRQLARLRTLKAQDKDKRHYNSKHRSVQYRPGDLVWIFIPVRKVGRSEKLLKRYFGPYQVLRQLSEVTYEVYDFDPTSKRRKSKEIVHVLRMKPYYEPEMQEDIFSDVSTAKRNADHNLYTGPITRSRTKYHRL